jgi:lysozyme family protein
MTLATVRAIDPVAAWAIARTLPLEGGLVDNPHDPGGVTAHGVSLRWALQEIAAHPVEIALFDVDHDGVVDGRDIRGLTPDQAADIYFTAWWQPGWYGRLSPAQVAWKCFDIAVNTGPKRAATILQKALARFQAKVVADGSVGPATLAAAAAVTAKAADEGLSLLNAIREEQAAFYRSLVAAKPGLGVFLKGWLNRAAA